MTTPTMTWTRLTRRLGADHNPLRRRADLIEAWLLPAAIAAFLILGPLVAGVAVLLAHDDNAAVRRAEQSWHPVAAVLLQATAGPLLAARSSDSWTVWAPARWFSGGRAHVAAVPATAGTRADTRVPVWLNRAGNVQPPPLTAGQARDHVIGAVAAALALLAAFLTILAMLGRRLLNRRRLAAWEEAWRSVGPQWSRQE